MARKKKIKKVKKVLKTKKVVRKKKAIKKKKKAVAKAQPKEKVLGRVEHFFNKISVAAVKVSAPFKVGDVIHIKGHTTDFFQRVESMQINHQNVTKVKKGDDVGIKVNDFVREHDLIYLADEKALTVQPAKPAIVQPTLFAEAAPQPAAKPVPPLLDPKKPEKKDPYSNTKFLKF